MTLLFLHEKIFGVKNRVVEVKNQHELFDINQMLLSFIDLGFAEVNPLENLVRTGQQAELSVVLQVFCCQLGCTVHTKAATSGITSTNQNLVVLAVNAWLLNNRFALQHLLLFLRV